MKVKVISFYTPGLYANHATQLSATCDQYGIVLEMREQGPFSCWHDAVCHKPAFIASMLAELTHWDGLLWVDADARFRGKPDWSIFGNIDIAACQFRWNRNHPLETLTGTLYFRCCEQVRAMVRAWCELTPRWAAANRDTPEQHSLQEAIATHRELRVLDLPKPWVWIEPDFNAMFATEQPIISHLQASRARHR